MDKLIRLIKEILRDIIKILYPSNNRCLFCNKEDIEGLCKKCCSDITACNNGNELCIGYYRGVLKKLIIDLKYKSNFEAGDMLVELIENKFDKINKDYYLTFIPISKKALKVRGFNQCEYIAKELGFRKNFKVINTLKKVKETKIQKELTKEQRKVNMYKAFDIIDKTIIKNKKIILIDDVMTTGSTIKEGIRVLRENGAIDVKVAVLAKVQI